MTLTYSKTFQHFPNVNFAIRKIHNMLGLQKYNKYFPIPTTTTALKKLKLYWNCLCKELGFEYDKYIDKIDIETNTPISQQTTLDQFFSINKTTTIANGNK